MAEEIDIDIAVVGTGPAGLATALAFAHGGSRVALIGPAPLPHSKQPLDTRTAALLESSVDMLKALGVWEAILPHAAPLKAIRIIDASGSLFRAPDVEFRASELGLDAFGYNIANSVLVEFLYAKAAGSVAALYPANVERVELTPSHARLRCAQGTEICVRLVAGADGRNSICRKAAGIAASEQAYGQAAIATSFAHRAPHRGVSIELHRQGGSVTTVPLTDAHASSVIWIADTEEIEVVMRLDLGGFAATLQDRLEGLLGQVDEVGARARFPIARLATETLAGRRTALVGEAAHILPPIGAQGLNLGLRDAATLADCVGEARKRGGDPGSDEMLSAYDRARKVDVLTRTYGIDLLSRSLLSGFLPLRAARGIVSHGLNALPPLRRLVMRIGMMPPTELPSLMRPGAQ
ncbi:FAD-dependent monooxygenase [Methyloceanibacter sp.]|uniref:FAD-dependent monooxygenase n=1 Tax=Methyloceanibacter sp. TaxID=1965321 RepID=UPI003D6D1F83